MITKIKLEMRYSVYLMDTVEAQWRSSVEVQCTRDCRDWNRIVRFILDFEDGADYPEKGDYEAALKEAFMKTDEDLRAGKFTCVRDTDGANG